MHEEDFDNLYDIKKKKRKSLLSKVAEMNDYSDESASDFLPSSLIEDPKPVENNSNEIDETSDDENWLGDLIKKGKIGKPRKRFTEEDDIFYDKKKKNKKKKDKKDKATDFTKEFATETALYHNLLKDQSSFVDSLQRQYDHLTSSKSTARGINKMTTDLIDTINSARSLSMQLVEKSVNLKKIIKELTFKEHKEMGIFDENGSNLGDYASTYLKQLIGERSNIINMDQNLSISDYSDDDMYASLSDSLSDIERPEEVEKYLEYENRNVKIYVVITDNDVDNYEFVAIDSDGLEIPDYPKPIMTSISVNRSTNIAVDTYGKKYNIIWK